VDDKPTTTNTPTLFNPDDPLARITRETRRANAALHDYALMGAGRSLDKLLSKYRNQFESNSETRPPTKRLGSLAAWSTTFHWQARVDRFDQIEHDKELAKWEERRAALREADWQAGEDLRKQVAAFLAELPKFITRNEDIVEIDGEKVKVITLGLNTRLGELAMVVQAASGLQRLPLGEPTADIRLHGAALDSAIERGLANLANLRQASVPEADTRNGGSGAGAAGQPAGPDEGGGDHPTAGTADGVVSDTG
jgi:hypothetical protein